jgi:hypothetical protein
MTSAKDIRSRPGQDIEWHQSQPQDQVLRFLVLIQGEVKEWEVTFQPPISSHSNRQMSAHAQTVDDPPSLSPMPACVKSSLESKEILKATHTLAD